MTDSVTPAADHRTIEIGPHRIHYERSGDGPDVVLVHGWPLHGGTWRHVVGELAPHYTCHVLDLPASGRTESDPGAEISVAEDARIVGELAERVGLERYSLVGHDSGGLIARNVAADRAEQVEALVVINSEIPGHISALLRVFLASTRLPDRGLGLRTVLGSRALRRLPLAMGGCFHDIEAAEGEFEQLFLDPIVDDPETRARQLTRIRAFRLSSIHALAEVHPRITAPTLLLWGADDPFFPVDRARAMAAQLGGPTRFETIPAAKLLVHEEYPVEVAARCHDFLSSAVAGTDDAGAQPTADDS